ncbi:hypothetical protein [Mesorhizobium sp. M4B.F.Ca.ET.089.01.1.1]|nr:hypothetical protein [Mesorhizobium sp. M4B.F.Ca.ET.089.01.1.1]
MPGYDLIVIILATVDDLWNEHRAEIVVIGALAVAGIVALVGSFQ